MPLLSVSVIVTALGGLYLMAICRIQYMHNDKLIRATTLGGEAVNPVYDPWKLCIIVQRCSYFAIPTTKLVTTSKNLKGT